MQKLIKQKKEIEVDIRRIERRIRKSKRTYQNCNITLKEIGLKVTNFYASNKDNDIRKQYMREVKLKIKSINETLSVTKEALQSDRNSLEEQKQTLVCVELKIQGADQKPEFFAKTISEKIQTKSSVEYPYVAFQLQT